MNDASSPNVTPRDGKKKGRCRRDLVAFFLFRGNAFSAFVIDFSLFASRMLMMNVQLVVGQECRFFFSSS